MDDRYKALLDENNLLHLNMAALAAASDMRLDRLREARAELKRVREEGEARIAELNTVIIELRKDAGDSRLWEIEALEAELKRVKSVGKPAPERRNAALWRLRSENLQRRLAESRRCGLLWKQLAKSLYAELLEET